MLVTVDVSPKIKRTVHMQNAHARDDTPVYLQSHAQRANVYVSSIAHRPNGTLSRCNDVEDPARNILGNNPRYFKDVRVPLPGSAGRRTEKKSSMVPKEARAQGFEFRKLEVGPARGERFPSPPPCKALNFLPRSPSPQ